MINYLYIMCNQKLSVPMEEPNRSKWIEAIEKVQPFDYYVSTYHLCQFHFLPEDVGTQGKKKTKKFILSGRVPSIFSNEGNNNTANRQSINMRASDVHGDINKCETIVSNSTEVVAVHGVIPSPNDYTAFSPEYLDADSLDYYEESNQRILTSPTITDAFTRDTITVKKAEYKKLLDEMVELAGLKVKMTKMENSLKEKSDEIKELRRKVRYHEHIQEKIKSKEEENQNPRCEEKNFEKFGKVSNFFS